MGSRQKYTVSSSPWVRKARSSAVSNSLRRPSGKVIFSVFSPVPRVNQEARKLATDEVPITTLEYS